MGSPGKLLTRALYTAQACRRPKRAHSRALLIGRSLSIFVATHREPTQCHYPHTLSGRRSMPSRFLHQKASPWTTVVGGTAIVFQHQLAVSGPANPLFSTDSKRDSSVAGSNNNLRVFSHNVFHCEFEGELPVNGWFPMRLQICVGLREVPVSKKPLIRRKRRRVNGLEHQMSAFDQPLRPFSGA